MGQVVHLDAESFNQAMSQKKAIVDFWAEWCGPCKFMNPIIEELSEEFKGKVFFGKVDIDNNSELAETHHISAVPTMLFFSSGKVVDQVIGAVSKESLRKKIAAWGG